MHQSLGKQKLLGLRIEAAGTQKTLKEPGEIRACPKNSKLMCNTEESSYTIDANCVELYLPLNCKHSEGGGASSTRNEE